MKRVILHSVRTGRRKKCGPNSRGRDDSDRGGTGVVDRSEDPLALPWSVTAVNLELDLSEDAINRISPGEHCLLYWSQADPARGLAVGDDRWEPCVHGRRSASSGNADRLPYSFWHSIGITHVQKVANVNQGVFASFPTSYFPSAPS